MVKIMLTNIVALGFAALSAACGGDTTNNYYGTAPPMEQKQENPCGNSLIYGGKFWEISSCKMSYFAREDCQLGIIGLDRGGLEYAFNFDKLGGGSLHYRGTPQGLTEVLSDHGDVLVVTDPKARFLPQASAKWQELNAALDRYNGFMSLTESGSPAHVDDNAFIPAPSPWGGSNACRDSSFYVGN